MKKINTQLRKTRYIELKQDIVFKRYFSRNKKVLKSLLKSFLPISDEITNIKILNLDEKDKIKAYNQTQSSLSLAKPTVNENNSSQNQSSSSINKTNSLGNQNNVSEKQSYSSETQLELKESSLYPENSHKKQAVLDLRVKLNTGQNINVEMQSCYKKHFLKRVLFYWAKLYSQDLEKGQNYDKLNPTYSLIFTSFPILDKSIKDFMSSFSIRRDKEPYLLFNKDLKIVIVELSKLTKSCEETIDLNEKWCYLLIRSAHLTKKEWKQLSADKEIKMALKHLQELSRDEELYQEAFSRQIDDVAFRLDKAGWIEQGLQKGKQEGLSQGKSQRNIEIALNMLNKNLELSLISQITGLSKDEITQLKKRFITI